ncbi:phage major capsid protein [Paenochrobactrum sp. BZR 588]|uniref:phage major capsid protein n=1 Tax=unclassified Paenochrobactrum TaxID=2639760 RepID=UPI0038529DD6
MNLIKNHTTTAAITHLAASAAPLRIKDGGDPLENIAKKFGDHAAEVMTKLGASNDRIKSLEKYMDEMAVKNALGNVPAPSREDDTIGYSVIRDEDMQNFAEKSVSGRGSASIQIKSTLTSATTDAAGSVGAGVVPYRDSDYVGLPKRRLSIRDLLPVVQVSGNSVEVLMQAGSNNNAAMVAEGELKPGSDMQLALATVPIRTLAHWMKASRQVLDDMPQLMSIIDGELIYGLKIKEEAQLLYGDGTGQNLKGLVPSATAFAAPAGVVAGTANSIDTLGLAILQNALEDLPADGIVVHPADWMQMRLLKNKNDEYLLGNPATNPARVLFGLPVVDTASMVKGTFLVGQFQSAATLYDRWEARIEVGYVADDFTRNLVTVLCEERIGLAVKRGAALTHGSFPTTPTGE